MTRRAADPCARPTLLAPQGWPIRSVSHPLRALPGVGVALAILSGFAPAAGQGTEGPPVELVRFAEDVRLLADGAGTPGGAVVVVLDGRVVLLEPFGVADGSGRPVGADTPFRVASVSKAFTATAVARLAAEGQVSMDADLRDGRTWLEESAPGREPVTLIQLLTHTAGFDDRVVGMFARDAREVRTLAEYLAQEMPPRTSEPGRWTRYNNHGAALAGLVLEEAAGEPFADAVARLVLEPSGMASSTFEQPLPEALLQTMARSYRCPPEECEPLPLDYRNTPPAGALVTTPEDMGRFMATLLGPGDALGAGTMEVLLPRRWSHRPELPGMALAFQEQSLRGHRGLMHAGTSSGYSSLLAIVPEVGAGLFLVTSGGSSRLGGSILDRFQELLPPSSGLPFLGPLGQPSSISEEEAQDYIGSYLLARAPRGSYESFPALFLFSQSLGTDAEGFLIRYEGGVRRRYGRTEGDLFASVDGVGRLAFERDQKGRVVAMHASDVFFGVRFPGSFERLPGWASPGFINELLSWALGLPVLAMLAWGIISMGGGLLRRIRRGKESTPAPPERRGRLAVTGLILVPVVSAFSIWFGFGFMARFNGIAMGSPELLAYGLPPELGRLLWLPWAILLYSLALWGVTGMTWIRRKGRIPDRLLLAVASLSSVAFIVLLRHFHLLPPVS